MTPSDGPTSEALRWAVIREEETEPPRFAIVSEVLREAGIENELIHVSCSVDDFPAEVERLKSEGVKELRLLGRIGEAVPRFFENLSSLMLTVKCADSLSYDGERYWPRNHLYQAFQRIIANDLHDLDLGGAAFVIGASAEARAAVAAFVRAGINRINLSDFDQQQGLAFIEELRSAYFKVQFQFTPRDMVTQLPGVHSMVVNTIAADQDPTALQEFFYFNFLKFGGVWLEIPWGSSEAGLILEARSVGAQIEPSARVNAQWETAWAAAWLKDRLNAASFRDKLAERFQQATAQT